MSNLESFARWIKGMKCACDQSLIFHANFAILRTISGRNSSLFLFTNHWNASNFENPALHETPIFWFDVKPWQPQQIPNPLLCYGM